jgi:hypothetical protein
MEWDKINNTKIFKIWKNETGIGKKSLLLLLDTE